MEKGEDGRQSRNASLLAESAVDPDENLRSEFIEKEQSGFEMTFRQMSGWNNLMSEYSVCNFEGTKIEKAPWSSG